MFSPGYKGSNTKRLEGDIRDGIFVNPLKSVMVAGPLMRALLGLILLTSLQVIANPAFAQERSIRLGIPEEGYPPYHMKAENGRYGIVADVFLAISKSMGYQVDVAVVPEKRMRFMAEQGQLDAVAAAKEWETRSTAGHYWTDGIIQVSDNIVMTAGQPNQAMTVDDLRGKDVALMEGYVYPSLENLIKTNALRSNRHKGFASLLRMVAANRVDYGILDANVAKWAIREQKLTFKKEIIFSEPGFDEVLFRILIYPHRDWSRYIQNFNAKLRTFKTDGNLDVILDRYR